MEDYILNEPVYHIYAKDRCLYNCLRQDEFEEKWEMLNIMVGLMKTDYNERDLSYEKLAADKKVESDLDLEPSY